MPGVGRCWLACFGGDVPWYLLEIVDGFELNKFLRRSWGGVGATFVCFGLWEVGG